MAMKAIRPYTKLATGMATPTRCPQELVRFPPSSRITAPATGKASSSHAARWAPTAVTVVMTAADGAAATEPVTGYLSTASGPEGTVLAGEGTGAGARSLRV